MACQITKLDIDYKTLKELLMHTKSANIIFQLKNKDLYEYDPKTHKLKLIGKAK